MVLTVAVVGKLDDSSCLLFFFFSAFLFSSVLFFLLCAGLGAIYRASGRGFTVEPRSGSGSGCRGAAVGGAAHVTVNMSDVNSE